MRFKECVAIVVVSLVLSTGMTFFLTFIYAYQSPEKQALVDINSLGEAKFEMFFIIPMAIISYIVMAASYIKNSEG